MGIILVSFFGVGAFSVHLLQKNFWNPLGSPEMVFEVSPGMTLTRAALDLQARGVLANAQWFLFFARLFYPQANLKVGEYKLTPEMSGREVLLLLTSGVSVQRQVLIPEGWNIFEIAQEFARLGLSTEKEFLQTIRAPALIRELLNEQQESLEGYLYPDTYNYSKGVDFRDVVRNMVRKSLQQYETLHKPEALPGWTRHQVFTLASIIEKETGAPEERPLISSVFMNRLQRNMRLQTDPTVIYGIALQTGSMINNIRKSDLSTPHPYNTYTQSGLPPGPIANPGAEAIKAVFSPARSEYLYFVSHNDGTHAFSKTYEEHLRAVRRFQLDPSARAGKSWRDLQKRDSQSTTKL